MTDEVAEGRLGAASSALGRAQTGAGSARLHTRGPVWWTASKLPWIGDDVTAVRTVAEVADDLTHDTLPELVDLGKVISPESLSPKGGQVALAPFRRAAPVLGEASREISRAERRVDAISGADLLQPLRAPVLSMQEDVENATEVTSRIAMAMRLLPTMLGGEGKRSYLLVTQNNAEIRSLGGTAGSVALVTADNGRITLGTQRASTGDGWGNFPEPVVRLTEGEQALYSDRLGQYALNATMTPEFPRAAQILRTVWEEREGQRVDGVISIDPVGLSYVMRGGTPVTLETGQTVDSSNVVSTLLDGVYRATDDPAEQDRVFASAARSIFDTLLTGGGDPAQALSGLAQAAGERRILVWSADASEREELSETVLAGRFLSGGTSSDTRPRVGLFLNDSGNDKMTYYLRTKVSVRSLTCYPDGAQDVEVSARLTNTAPLRRRRAPGLRRRRQPGDRHPTRSHPRDGVRLRSGRGRPRRNGGRQPVLRGPGPRPGRPSRRAADRRHRPAERS